MTLRCPPGRSYRRVRARGGRSRWGGPNYNLLETHGFVVGPQDDFPGAPARELRCPPRCERSLGDGGGGSCGFVLQLRYVDPKVDVFLVQIAPSADSGRYERPSGRKLV